MKIRLLAVLAAFIALFPANGVFHTVLAAGFFDRELGGLAPAVLPMHEARPFAVAILDLTLAALIVYVVGRGSPTPARGALGGFVVNLASSAAWNLGNAASFRSWPIAVISLDMLWHCALGAFAGFVAAAALRRAPAPAHPLAARG
jgi:uncharacterized membrane protein